MTWLKLAMIVAVGVAAVLPTAGSAEREPPSELFKECREAGQVPAALQTAYAAFVAAAREGKVEPHCLPHVVAVSTEARPEKTREYGGVGDLNLPFIQQGFSAGVRLARKDGADCWLLRTGSTAVRFVRTHSGEWRVYSYLDKPIA